MPLLSVSQFLSYFSNSEDIQQCTEKSTPVSISADSAILISFGVITVFLATVSVILGVVNYKLKVSLNKMKSKLNETETALVQTVEMEKVSDVKPASQQLQVSCIHESY